MAEADRLLAHRVLAENLKVKKGESVVIESWPHSLDQASEFVREARSLGAHPTILYEDEGAWWDAVESKETGVLSSLSDAERAVVKAADVFIYFWGPGDRPRAARLPPKTQEKVTGWNEEWYRLARRGGLRGCRMSIAQATDPEAERYGIDGTRWRQRLLDAGAESARDMLARGKKVEKALRAGRTLTIQHPNGTDLSIRLDGLHTRVDVGVVDAEAMRRPYGLLTNNPSGQVFVAVDRARAEGTLVSNRTVYLGSERFGECRWAFSGGHLTDHSVGLGGEVFEKAFSKAPKGRDLLGYLSIGLNPGSRDLPPVEDTEEGAVLIGVGRNTMAGGKNRNPFLGYAMIGEAAVAVDGRPIATAGRLT